VSFVIDASVTLAFAFPDERDAAALAVAADLRRSGAIAPAIWAWEVQNAVVASERRKRIAPERTTTLLYELTQLPVQLEVAATFGDEAALARRFQLSVYDALYLELAFRRGLPLATRDAGLAAAAAMLGLETRGR